MDIVKRPVNQHDAYHAHVYFDAETLSLATDLYHEIEQAFSLELGRIHQKPVGPHTRWSFQILFTHADFDSFITWLDQHRRSLSVLVHGDTGDDMADHTQYAYWLGDAVDLDLRAF